jgi:hypothetical protein
MRLDGSSSLTWPRRAGQVSHAANYLEKQVAFVEEVDARIWVIDDTELSDAQSAAKEAVEAPVNGRP